MTTAAITIRNKARIEKYGKVTFSLRITHQRKPYYSPICTVDVQFADIDKMKVRTKHPTAATLNRKIADKLSDALTAIEEAERLGVEFDPVGYLNKVPFGDTIGQAVKNKSDRFFYDAKISTGELYKVLAGHIERSSMDVALSSINEAWAGKFMRYLGSVGQSPNTQAHFMIMLKSVLTDARKAKVLQTNPLEFFQPKKKETMMHKPTIEDLHKLASVELTGWDKITRDMFLFGLLARGMRYFDLVTMRWSGVDGSRYRYMTQKNKKQMDIEITPEMVALMPDRGESEYIWPFITLPYSHHDIDGLLPGMSERDRSRAIERKRTYRNHVSSANSMFGKDLRRIALAAGVSSMRSSHMARHFFAYQFIEDGGSIVMLQQLLGHSNIATTMKYSQALRKTEEMDQAAAKVQSIVVGRKG